MKRVQHKIRGSHPGFIGIELPNEYNVILVDEENFDCYRRNGAFKGISLEVKDHYCHFKKPVEGSWHLIIEGESCDFAPENIHIIYKAA